MEKLSRFYQILRETPFNNAAATAFTADCQNDIFIISIIYMTVIFGIQKVMKEKPAFEFRKSLPLWNLFLAIFSAIGAYKTGKGLFSDVLKHGITETYCKKTAFWHGDSGYWTFLFGYSKILEFGDTLFIVLRKRPLIFLHWYHHVATLNYAILGYTSFSAYNSWIVWLNLIIHSIMYFYYFLSACKIRIPPFISQIITTLQISQFMITHLILCHIGYLTWSGYPCDVTLPTYACCLIMEISYVYLFGKMYYESYIKNGGKKFKQS